MSAGFQAINLNDLMKELNIKNAPIIEKREHLSLSNSVLDENIKNWTDFQGIGPINAEKLEKCGYSIGQVIQNPELLYDCGLYGPTVDGIISMNPVLRNNYKK